MKKTENKKEMKQFLFMVATGLPGLLLAFGGAKFFEASRGFSVAGAVMFGAGLCLVVTCGCYHYRKDYAERGEGALGFLALTAFSALVAVIVTRIIW